jgi:hypothetical protein
MANARVSSSEATAVAIHPITGDPIFCFARPSDPLPERYRRLGYEKRQFHSIHELRRWCASKGLTNDVTDYDQPHEGFMEDAWKQQEEADRRWRETYARERELAARAMGVGQHRVRVG